MHGMADAFTSEMRNNSNFYLQLDSDDPIVMRGAITQLELDVLVYGELGMAQCIFLSFSKLALVLQFLGPWNNKWKQQC